LHRSGSFNISAYQFSDFWIDLMDTGRNSRKYLAFSNSVDVVFWNSGCASAAGKTKRKPFDGLFFTGVSLIVFFGNGELHRGVNMSIRYTGYRMIFISDKMIFPVKRVWVDGD
jgi:hypothetical protein